MIVSQTMFIDGQPVGLIRKEINPDKCKVTFEPRDGSKRLAARKWASVNACRKAIIKTYQQEHRK